MLQAVNQFAVIKSALDTTAQDRRASETQTQQDMLQTIQLYKERARAAVESEKIYATLSSELELRVNQAKQTAYAHSLAVIELRTQIRAAHDRELQRQLLQQQLQQLQQQQARHQQEPAPSRVEEVLEFPNAGCWKSPAIWIHCGNNRCQKNHDVQSLFRTNYLSDTRKSFHVSMHLISCKKVWYQRNGLDVCHGRLFNLDLVYFFMIS